MNEIDRSKLTQQLLYSIASRLSGRADCKGINYDLTIEEVAGATTISFNPAVSVYPDRHHRKDSDKISIVDFIVRNKFSDYTFKTDEGTWSILPDILVLGNYHYEVSVDKRKRRWTRLL